MSSVESCRQLLSSEPGVAELLVQYLHEKPRSGASDIEKSACEQLQQRSAVAISRLSHSHDVGLIFVELHCKPHCHLLVQLCFKKGWMKGFINCEQEWFKELKCFNPA